MRKIKYLFVVLIALLSVSLMGCNKNKYKEYAGVYECASITIDGINAINNYEYFTITLNADGTCVIRSKGKGVGTPTYEATATYSVNDEKIKVVTKEGGATVTEEYDFYDNRIVMRSELNGLRLYAIFTKKEADD